MSKIELELMRHNVTPAQFLAYVRASVKKHGYQEYTSDLDLEYFAAGNDLNFDINNKNNPSAPVAYERSVSKPYECQTYVRYWDGSTYNEIIEFDFWDDKTGTGYYYLLDTQA